MTGRKSPYPTDGKTRHTRRLSQKERSISEIATGLDVYPQIKTTRRIDIGQEAALDLVGQMLDERHYTLLLDKTGYVVTPDRKVLCTLLKGRLNHRDLCPGLLDAVRPIVRKAARQPVRAAIALMPLVRGGKHGNGKTVA